MEWLTSNFEGILTVAGVFIGLVFTMLRVLSSVPAVRESMWTQKTREALGIAQGIVTELYRDVVIPARKNGTWNECSKRATSDNAVRLLKDVLDDIGVHLPDKVLRWIVEKAIIQCKVEAQKPMKKEASNEANRDDSVVGAGCCGTGRLQESGDTGCAGNEFAEPQDDGSGT